MSRAIDCCLGFFQCAAGDLNVACPVNPGVQSSNI
jgi:hypothetical protein